MKQKLIIILLWLPMAVMALEGIRLGGSLGYGYNLTWHHYGMLDMKTVIPVNPHFETDAALRLNTANLYAASVNLRPVFPLPKGSMYLETKLMYLANVRNRIHDLNAALSLGYRMDYVTVQIGAFTHMMSEFGRDWNSENEILTEPISAIYQVEARVRPATSDWNILMRIANYDDFQVERFYQPMFTLGAKYRVWNSLWLWVDALCKPTGMFHLNAGFYGIQTRAGLVWQFSDK